MVKTEIILTNLLDLGFEKEGYIKKEEIRRFAVEARVDTEDNTLTIPEDLRKHLGLKKINEKIVKLANGHRVTSHVTDMVLVRWNDREWPIKAQVIPGSYEVVLGIQETDIKDFILELLENKKGGIRS
ncbi:MAG: hypothetical protein FWG77_11295 [Treponema sp.]|nr:hypothetical protein [Treponema sp.]